MAYVNQELKSRIAPKVKTILLKYGLSGGLSVRHHSTLVLTIRSGKLDFIANFNKVSATKPEPRVAKDCLDVNRHWFQEQFDGEVKECLSALFHELNDGNHDRSDIQTDYFDVGWYVDVNIGQWNKPYIKT